YKERKVKVGTRTVYDRVPAYEWQKVQTGWRDNPAYQGESGASTSSGKGPGLNSVVPPEGSNGRNSSGGGNGSQYDYNDEKKLFQNRQQRFLAQQAGHQRDQPTGTPPPPTATPYPYRAPSPESYSTPYPTGQRAAGEYEPTVEVEGKWIAKGARWAKKVRNFFTARAVAFNSLDSGHISVSAPTKATGSRRSFLNRFGFRGTRYNPSTITGITGRQLIKGSLSKSTWITAAVTSIAGNVIDYGFGKNKDKGIVSQEFAVSTTVDTVMAVGSGLVAAATVALIGAGIAAVTPFALSAAAGIALTAAAGVGIGYLLDRYGVNKKAKDIVNKGVDAVEEEVIKLKDNVVNGINAWGGAINNAKIIRQHVKDQAKNTIQDKVTSYSNNINGSVIDIKNKINNAAQSVKNKVEEVRASVSNSLSGAADTIKGIFGGSFGG
ncbi:MAG: hypothetical protein KGY69_19800, partial [Bacteroidales bacterium]|nr:hypothetical protein [Bacteroidales bacterium]